MREHLPGGARCVLCFAVLAALVFSGCSPADSNTGNASGTEVLAEFEGGEVTRAEFEEQLEAFAQQSGGELPSEGGPRYQQLVARIMPQLVSTEIAADYAEENGITVSEGEVDEELERVKAQIGEQARSQGQQDISDEEAYQQALEQAGFTEEELRPDIREQLLVQKVQEEVAGDVEPTDEEVRSYYDENRDTFTEPETRCARHILFSPDQESRAQDVKRQLENGGDFAALAEEYSQDSGTAEEGGDLGCQPETDPRTGQPTYAPAFSDALFADDAEEGDIIGPVETEFGYHVIELREIREESTPPLREVEGQIRDRLIQEEQSTRFQEWLADEIEQRNVSYKEGYDPGDSGQAAPGGGTSGSSGSSGGSGGGG